jgi:lipid-A-disaccharide synthase
MQEFKVMFVAGDPSGDEHASHIVRELTGLIPDIKCFGIGGAAMQAAGFSALMPFEEFNRMGLFEVLIHLPFFLDAKKKLISAMDEMNPDALVCVDYPGLNMELMKEARRRNIPVVWYIAPQVWAWKKKRAVTLGRQASFICTVFPFENPYFEGFGAKVEFVGHPLVEALDRRRAQGNVKNQDRVRISIIPGSRKQEVESMLPAMAKAALMLKNHYSGVSVTVSKCRHLPLSLYEKACSDAGFEMFEGCLADLLDNTDLAYVTSGTATLETALSGVPLVIAYRTSIITYTLLKRMINIKFIGLPNIVAGEKIVPECIQKDVSPKVLYEAMKPFIDSREFAGKTREKLAGLKHLLGSKKPSEEMARVIRDILMKRGRE